MAWPSYGPLPKPNISYVGYFNILADRTRPTAHGRAYATGTHRLSVGTECTVAKRCDLEQKLLLTAYRRSYMRNRLVPK